MAGLVCYYNSFKFHYFYITHDETLGKHLRVMSSLPDQIQSDVFTPPYRSREACRCICESRSTSSGFGLHTALTGQPGHGSQNNSTPAFFRTRRLHLVSQTSPALLSACVVRTPQALVVPQTLIISITKNGTINQTLNWTKKMKPAKASRRKFIRESVSSAASLVVMSAFPDTQASAHERSPGDPVVRNRRTNKMIQGAPRIRFSVIGINHDHIHGQIAAAIRGGGQFVAFYAKEPNLAATFAKRYPQARQARNEKEILEDNSIELVVSAAIPVERAPLGIAVMWHRCHRRQLFSAVDRQVVASGVRPVFVRHFRKRRHATGR